MPVPNLAHDQPAASNDAGCAAADLSRLCGILDQLRGDVALLDAAGLHDIADRLDAYEQIVRRLVHAAIREVCAAA
jgi:hypothetical protein